MKTGQSVAAHDVVLPNCEKILIVCAVECVTKEMLAVVHQYAEHAGLNTVDDHLVLAGLKATLLNPNGIAPKLNTILRYALELDEDLPAEQVDDLAPTYNKLMEVYAQNQQRLEDVQRTAQSESKALAKAMMSDMFESLGGESEPQQPLEQKFCTCSDCELFRCLANVTDFSSAQQACPFAASVFTTLQKLQDTYGS